MNQTSRRISVRDLTTIAILGALSALLFMIDFPLFPAVSFYKIDFSNVPALLGAFAMGPWQGTMVVLLKSVIGLTHSTSMGVGELADFLMGAALVIPAGYLYRRMQGRKGAVLSMLLGIAASTLCAALVNLWLLIPFYSQVYGMPIEKIVSMGTALFPAVTSFSSFILLVTVPFNLIKGLAVCLVVLLIYKPLSPVLHDKKKKVVKAE